MSYGLSRFIKNLLPKRLFYRALLIVAVPIIFLQLIITIVFFDSLWIKTNKGMTRALIGEIKTFIAAYDYGNYNNNDLSGLFEIYLDLNVEYKEDGEFKSTINERWYSPIDRTLRRELKSHFGNDSYWFSTTNYKDLIHINIRHDIGYFKFLITKYIMVQPITKQIILYPNIPNPYAAVIVSPLILSNILRFLFVVYF